MYTVLSNILLILWRVKFGSFVKSFGVLDIEKVSVQAIRFA